MKATEHKDTGERMDIYEVSFLIVPSVSEDKVADEMGAIRSGIESAGASIIAEEFPKSMSLAYTMERIFETKKQKFNTAYFGWIKFELPVASLANIKEMLDKKQNILRHLIVKTVRENTMYSAKLAEAANEQAGEVSSASTEGEKKEIDKSIDALVIS